jgi:NAD(P)-dependent dehydrogenase (short-subunit alcohol dehydrogenase family)
MAHRSSTRATPRAAARRLDRVLEATVIGSFSRVGYEVRSRAGGEHWAPLARMDGKVVVLTGATSGIGLSAAASMARLGAAIRFPARDAGRAERARDVIVRESGNDDVHYANGDLSEPDSLRSFAAWFAGRHDRLDVLVHNAGLLSREYRTTRSRVELTVATQVLGPFLLTELLLPHLERKGPARVITVTSGGMYTQRFDVAHLELPAESYNGVKAYARAKRAQVVLTHEWARRFSRARIVFHAMHPGWVDTPGLHVSLKTFGRIMRPVLRTVEQGADSMVWLAAAPDALRSSGRLWLDRAPRSEQRLPGTRPRDDVADGARLWDWCSRRTLREPAVEAGTA